MLPPKELKRAIQLYDRYQSETSEFESLARSVGWNIGELNRHIWHIKQAERKKRETQ